MIITSEYDRTEMRALDKQTKQKKSRLYMNKNICTRQRKKRQKEYQQYKKQKKKTMKYYINIGKVLTRAHINFADVADRHSSSLCCIRLHIDLVCKLLSKMKNLVYCEYGSVPRCDPVRN